MGAVWAFLLLTYRNEDESYILINDNLDGLVPIYRVLSQSPSFFGELDATVEPIFNGIPRNCLPSEFQIGVLLYRLFDPLYAFIINDFVIHTVALVGMVLLLKR